VSTDVVSEKDKVAALPTPVTETNPPAGYEVRVAANVDSSLSAIPAAVLDAPKNMSTFEPVVSVLAVFAFKLIAEITPAAVSAPCAGITEVSPNPSEATATTATFFNEIVFTIFLSFSQIKEFLLSGW
jgi:hypothetical protein